MRLQILELARNDLIEGFYFYENKEKGLGDYFLANRYSDIESLKYSALSIASHIASFTAPFQKDSHSRSTTRLKAISFESGRS